MRMPTAEAIQCVEVTTPKVPNISGRVVKVVTYSSFPKRSRKPGKKRMAETWPSDDISPALAVLAPHPRRFLAAVFRSMPRRTASIGIAEKKFNEHKRIVPPATLPAEEMRRQEGRYLAAASHADDRGNGGPAPQSRHHRRFDGVRFAV
jgi:hypothetical protein